MNTVTRAERPDAPVSRELIAELDAILQPNYPPESQHGYSIDKLVQEGVAFFVVYVDDEPAGCGGVQLYGSEYAELKRMYVRPAFRGNGLGKLLVEHLTGYAVDRGVTVIRLETGVQQVEAIALYTGMGFERIPPFGPYWDDPVSLCMEKRIEARGPGAL
jgi:GNAT superfamily N-acetyltransferase